MRKERIKGKQTKDNQNQSRLPKPISMILNKVLPVLILLVAGFFFAPYASMNFQNNDVKTLSDQAPTVMFYKSDCSHCQKAYPIVFWHNILNCQQPDKQIQTINVQNPNNKHYLVDYQVQDTPTFMQIKNSSERIVATDKKQILTFAERNK
ncbi:thiol-disulfide isomerase [Leuconostoc gelidum subsp. gasicomitatum]|uniref:thioredoxin domain-containing protein n=1 Tax=Leuconostoc gelidum group TaxID=3016637 RepID=UPI001C7CF6D4|nr:MULTISPECIES: thioredoxin domain-containing protein [Leuconostoc gelidum group]MBZ5961357.1 thiol-disulfide isomerase [Leuconostoc gasicomitatum]MBZ5994639.1 thiol-disulfide isomerase [Leuconostoc gasicomitatum]MBZ6009749.1 thiol-disulfide isomerase [Leuconostoc gelidum subsp. aenigmaticum]